MKKINLLASILILSALFVAAPQASAQTTQITNNSLNDSNTGVSDGKIVWNGFDAQGLQIFLYDINSQVTTQLTHNDYFDQAPRIKYGKVMWDSHINNPNGDIDLMFYNIATGVTTQLVTNGGGSLGINKVFYSTSDSDVQDSEIFIYDVPSGTRTQITDNNYVDGGANGNDEKVVWNAITETTQTIMLYDIASAQTTQIGSGGSPILENDKVVWVRNNNIFLYDIPSHTTTQITSNSVNLNPLISDGRVVWIRYAGLDKSIMMYDISTGITSTLTTTNGGEFGDLVFSNDRIAWLEASQVSQPREVYTYKISTGVKTQLTHNSISNSDVTIDNGDITWAGWDGNDGEIFLWQEPDRQLTALAPANVWVSKGILNLGVRFDFLAEVYKDNTLVSSGQVNSVQVGSGSFNQATQVAIPFNTFSAVDFPAGSALKVKVSVRNACSGSLLNNGTATLWYNTAQQNSRFGATIEDTASDYYLRDAFALATAAGSGPRRNIAVAAGARCSAFKTFGTWTITP